MFNDAWFHYVQDIGPAGPDKGQQKDSIRRPGT
jgi:hypothetical protein